MVRKLALFSLLLALFVPAAMAQAPGYSSGPGAQSGLGAGGSITACTNTTPVTANTASATVPQNLMTCTLPVGVLNLVNRHVIFRASGLATVPAGGSAGAVTIAFSLGGTVLCTRLSTTVMTVGVTNAPWSATCDAVVTTAGSSGAFETYELANLPTVSTATISAFGTTNTAVVSSFNLTSALTLQVTVTVSVNAASANQFVAVERLLSARVED
jgi:hypothetical protein